MYNTSDIETSKILTHQVALSKSLAEMLNSVRPDQGMGWGEAQLPHSPPHTCVPINSFAGEVFWAPRFHSELQLRPAEIVLLPRLCAQNHLGGFAGGPASQTQLPEEQTHKPRQETAVTDFGAKRSSFESWLFHLLA
jgi:hypothetical protein